MKNSVDDLEVVVHGVNDDVQVVYTLVELGVDTLVVLDNQNNQFYKRIYMLIKF